MLVANPSMEVLKRAFASTGTADTLGEPAIGDFPGPGGSEWQLRKPR